MKSIPNTKIFHTILKSSCTTISKNTTTNGKTVTASNSTINSIAKRRMPHNFLNQRIMCMMTMNQVKILSSIILDNKRLRMEEYIYSCVCDSISKNILILLTGWIMIKQRKRNWIDQQSLTNQFFTLDWREHGWGLVWERIVISHDGKVKAWQLI